MKHIRPLWGLLAGLLLSQFAARGQGTGWERVDVFGTGGFVNVNNQYLYPLVNQGAIVASAFYPWVTNVNGGPRAQWVSYDLNGTLLWRQGGQRHWGATRLAPWGRGTFAAGAVDANNALQATGQYVWLRANGDTARVVGLPTTYVAQLPWALAERRGKYYIAGGGDGSGTGQTPLALHYALLCIDSAGAVLWQRQYLNPLIQLGTNPQFAGGYSYLQHLAEAPRNGWLLLGHTARDDQGRSGHFQMYAVEVDSLGQQRRARWVEPFGRRASVLLPPYSKALRLRDGSGYVTTGTVEFDTLGSTRPFSFVAKIDTALRPVWSALVPGYAPGPGPTGRLLRGVSEGANGELHVLAYAPPPHTPENEFEILRFSKYGQELGRAVYCSQVCTKTVPLGWQYLPDSSLLVAGWGEQRAGNRPTGRLLATPAWLARFAQPCRRLGPLATAAPRPAAQGLALYPQPATAGGEVTLALDAPLAGPVQLLDALGRVVATGPAPGGRLLLPAGLAPGLYAVRVPLVGRPPATARLLVQ